MAKLHLFPQIARKIPLAAGAAFLVVQNIDGSTARNVAELFGCPTSKNRKRVLFRVAVGIMPTPYVFLSINNKQHVRLKSTRKE
jgi:hypothetical protein